MEMDIKDTKTIHILYAIVLLVLICCRVAISLVTKCSTIVGTRLNLASLKNGPNLPTAPQKTIKNRRLETLLLLVLPRNHNPNPKLMYISVLVMIG